MQATVLWPVWRLNRILMAVTNITAGLSRALADRYTLDRDLGRGGMATVYLARDIRHERQVAIKVLHPELAAVLGAERFLAEIKTTANLQHPHILPLFDSGTADGQLFYVMPFVEGETLRAKLDRETQLPIDDALRIAREVADALQYAHDRGVIHRDIKPENILLQGGHALVADFGIALAVQHAGAQRLTQTGLSLGTPQYMAPEQAMGDKAVDARADIYALGAVVYEMLAGEPPFTGPTAQAIIAKVLTSTAPPLTSLRAKVPLQVEETVQRALEKLPADRWASAREFADSLSRSSHATGANKRGSNGVGAAVNPSRTPTFRREFAAWCVAAASLIAVAVVVFRNGDSKSAIAPTEFEITLPDSVTATPRGSNASVAFTPDGSTLVFQGTGASGEAMLFTRRLDERVVRPVRGSEGAKAPIVTPDGKDVLFSIQAENRQPLRRVSLAGGSPQTVASSVSGNVPVSFLDSARFVFMHNDTLWTSTGDQNTERLLAVPDKARNHVRYSFPDVLPGGTHLLVSIFKGSLSRDSSSIGVVSVTDSRAIELGLRGGNPRYAAGHLFYVSVDGTLMAAAFDARSLKVSGKPFVIAENVRTSLGPGSAAGYAVSSDGTVVWLTGGTSAGDLAEPVIVSRSGQQQKLGVTPGVFLHPRVSPDGGQVAITLRRENRQPDIWRFNLSDGVLQRVTTNADSDFPEWMPDRRRLSFSRMQEDSTQHVVELVAGATPRPLFRVDGFIGSGDVGPAGGYGAFSVIRPGSEFDIWLVHGDSLQSPRPLLSEVYAERSPRIFPDGRFIAYESNRTGRREVYVQSLTRRDGEVLVSANGGSEPHWSRDGKEVFFISSDSMFVARIETAPSVSVSRHSLFAMQLFVTAPTRSVYDVLPGNRGLLMLLRVAQRTEVQPRMVIRTNVLRDIKGTVAR